MNRKWVRGVALMVVLALGAGLAWRLWPTERQRVEGRLEALAKMMHKSEPSQTLTLASRLMGMDKLVASPCGLQSDVRGFSGEFTPRELSQLALQALTEMETARLEFSHVQVEFPSEGQAQVLAAAALRGTVEGGEAFAEFRAVLCTLEKQDGAWKFTRFEIIPSQAQE